ncbi:MBL fold metallo-hydrolase [candidate division KSB1 bacterium]|nr:MBL fold metallo-hydrolase [candidate division KSB1 bacterium]
MEICVLASGSNGNALYIESRTTRTAILIDCGISRLQIARRLWEKGKTLENVSAIFLSHEHTDHTRGVNVTTKLFGFPVYMTEGTYGGLRDKRYLNGVELIHQSGESQIGDLTIQSIPKSHDARDPIAFAISCNGKMFLTATDFGIPNDDIISSISSADAILLEMNYDEEMLKNGPYPYWLQQRILSNHGHMSNVHSASLIFEHANSRLRHLILGHLSENNNDPRLVQREIDTIIERRDDLNPVVHIASRYKAGDIIQLT